MSEQVEGPSRGEPHWALGRESGPRGPGLAASSPGAAEPGKRCPGRHPSEAASSGSWDALSCPQRRPYLRRQQRRRPQRRSTRWSSSSSDSDPGSQGSGDSSSSSEDTEPEPEESWRRGQAPPSPQHVVPDMDLWVPARQSPSQPRGAGVRTWTQQPVAGGATADRREAPAVASAPAAPRQAQTPSGSELSPRTGDPRPASPEESACQVGPRGVRCPGHLGSACYPGAPGWVGSDPPLPSH